VVAQQHADRRVDDLAGDAVALLVGAARAADQPERCSSSKRRGAFRSAVGTPAEDSGPTEIGFMPGMTKMSPLDSVCTRCGASSR
jgi:hypothetical protein